MPVTVRPPTLFLALFFLGFTFGISVVSDDGAAESHTRAASPEPERLIPGLPIPALLSSLLALKPTLTSGNAIPGMTTAAPGGLPLLGTEVPIPIISMPLPTSLPLPVSLPLPIPTTAPDLAGVPAILASLTALLPSVSVPIVDITPLLSELTALLPSATIPLVDIPPLLSDITALLPSVTVPAVDIPPLISEITALLPSITAPGVDIPPLLSEITGLLPSVTASGVDIPPLLSDITGLLPSASIPLADIPPLLSEITRLVPEITSDLAPVLPMISSLAGMLGSEVSGAMPAVGSLESMVSSQVAELTENIGTVASMIITELPVVTLELPSLTIPVPLPTSLLQQVSKLPLLGDIPLSDLPAKLSSVIGDVPDNAGLVGSIVGAILSTLEGVGANIIGEVTVLPGSVLSLVTRDDCSKLVLTGGSMVTISVPCSSAQSVSVASPSTTGSTSSISAQFSSSTTMASPASTPSISSALSTSTTPASLTSSSPTKSFSSKPGTASSPTIALSPSSTFVLLSPSISSRSTSSSPAPPFLSDISSSPVTSGSSARPATSTSTAPGFLTSASLSSSVLAVGSTKRSPDIQTSQTPPVPAISTVTLSQPSRATTTLVTTVTTVQISILTNCPVTDSVLCPSAKPCPLCPSIPPCSVEAGTSTSAAPVAVGQGPCPGQGYTCEECLDGWFCPPAFTPAQPAPCGNGWPCYHCANGWFCVPPQTPSPATVTECPLLTPSSLRPTAPAGQSAGASNTRVTKGTMTITSTTFTTVSVSSQETLHLPVAGWQYGGCYKEVPSRGLKNASITTPNNSMTPKQCITFCKSNGFGLAGVEKGYMCFCGDVLVDSWPVDDTECDIPCSGDSGCSCGGTSALSIWSPDWNVPREFGTEHEFIMPIPAPGQTEMTANIGFVRHTVIHITTLVDEWPAGPSPVVPKVQPQPAAPGAGDGGYGRHADAANRMGDVHIDIEGIASTVHAIVSAAMEQAQQIAASEVAKANSMIANAKSVVSLGFGAMPDQMNNVVGDAFPRKKVVWTTCSTTVTSCSSTTTIGTTTTCTRSGFITKSSSSQASGVAPMSPSKATSSSVSTQLPVIPVNSSPPVGSPGAPTPSSIPTTVPQPSSSSSSSSSTPTSTGGIAPLQQSAAHTPSSSGSSGPSTLTNTGGVAPLQHSATQTPLPETNISLGPTTPMPTSPSGLVSVRPVGQSTGPSSESTPLSPSPSTPVAPVTSAPLPPSTPVILTPKPGSSTNPLGASAAAPIPNGPSTTPSSPSSPSEQSTSSTIATPPTIQPQPQAQTATSVTPPNVSPSGTVSAAPVSSEPSATSPPNSLTSQPAITVAPVSNPAMETYFFLVVSEALTGVTKEARSFTA